MTETEIQIPDAIRATWLSIGTALTLVILGALAALLPMTVGVALEIFIVWVIVFSDSVYLALLRSGGLHLPDIQGIP